MFNILFAKKFNGMGIDIIECGIHQCERNFTWKPIIRDFYTMHFIYSGKGIFNIGKSTYELSANQGFIIYPGIINSFKADANDPWKYAWIGFRGSLVDSILSQANLSLQNPTFRYEDQNYIIKCFEELMDTKRLTKGMQASMLGYFMLLMSHLLDISRNEIIHNKKEYYINKAVEFITLNYASKITLSDISDHIGIEDKYLCSFFKDNTGFSPYAYLINLRIKKACELLHNNILSISEISRSVGYNDPFLFSKMFKKIQKYSPSEYRKLLNNL